MAAELHHTKEQGVAPRRGERVQSGIFMRSQAVAAMRRTDIVEASGVDASRARGDELGMERDSEDVPS